MVSRRERVAKRKEETRDSEDWSARRTQSALRECLIVELKQTEFKLKKAVIKVAKENKSLKK